MCWLHVLPRNTVYPWYILRSFYESKRKCFSLLHAQFSPSWWVSLDHGMRHSVKLQRWSRRVEWLCWYLLVLVSCSFYQNLFSLLRLRDLRLTIERSMAFTTWRIVQIAGFSAAIALAFVLDAPDRNNISVRAGLLNFVHLLSCSLWFGVQTWVTFGAGEWSIMLHFLRGSAVRGLFPRIAQQRIGAYSG